VQRKCFETVSNPKNDGADLTSHGKVPYNVKPQSGVGGWVRSTNLCHHSRQWFNILNPRSDRIHYTVVLFVTHDCIRRPELWKQLPYECEL